MPVAATLRQTAPNAAFLPHVEIRVDHAPIVDLEVAARRGQQMFNSVELLVRELCGDLSSSSFELES